MIEVKTAAILLAAGPFLLTAAAAQAQSAANQEQARSERWRAQIAQRCARSIFPKECDAAGLAAFGASSALFSCRLGGDPAREASFVARRRARGYATQSEVDMYCGDLVETCESSWRAFERRARARAPETTAPRELHDFDERLADYCDGKAPDIYVD